MKFKNILHYTPFKGEVNNEPSLTVPDQTMSMRTILERHSRGLPFTDGKEPIYHGEDEFIPNPLSLDLVDRQEMAELRNKVAEIKDKAAKDAAEKAAKDAAEKAAKDAAKQGGEADAVE